MMMIVCGVWLLSKREIASLSCMIASSSWAWWFLSSILFFSVVARLKSDGATVSQLRLLHKEETCRKYGLSWRLHLNTMQGTQHPHCPFQLSWSFNSSSNSSSPISPAQPALNSSFSILSIHYRALSTPLISRQQQFPDAKGHQSNSCAIRMLSFERSNTNL